MFKNEEKGLLDQGWLLSNPNHFFCQTKKKKLNLRDLIIRLWALKCKAGCLAAPERQRELDGGNFATYRWIADLPQQVAVKKKKITLQRRKLDKIDLKYGLVSVDEMKNIYIFFSAKSFFVFFVDNTQYCLLCSDASIVLLLELLRHLWHPATFCFFNCRHPPLVRTHSWECVSTSWASCGLGVDTPQKTKQNKKATSGGRTTLHRVGQMWRLRNVRHSKAHCVCRVN